MKENIGKTSINHWGCSNILAYLWWWLVFPFSNISKGISEGFNSIKG